LENAILHQAQSIAKWYLLSVDDAIDRLKTRRSGLSGDEARQRLQQFGANELERQKALSPFMLLIEQFTNSLIVILIVAAIVAAIIGEGVEAIAIIVIVVLAGVQRKPLNRSAKWPPRLRPFSVMKRNAASRRRT
jgi:magnesium-transporting ATPase (P-type)